MKNYILSWNDVKQRYLEFHRMDSFNENMAIDIDFGYWLVNNCIIPDAITNKGITQTNRAMKIEWFKTSENKLPNDRQRVLFYRSTKLTKIGEMIFFDREPDRTHFLEEIEFWANEINKPTD